MVGLGSRMNLLICPVCSLWFRGEVGLFLSNLWLLVLESEQT